MKKINYFLIILLFNAIAGHSQEPGGSVARSGTFGSKPERLSEVTSEKPGSLQTGLQAQQFIEMARQLMTDGNFSQAKEALKTAIRLEPMNNEAWALYDEAVIAEYLELRRKEKLEPVFEQNLEPLFQITRVDTYIEINTLFVVGSLKNLSDKVKHKIRLTAKIYDAEQKELRRQNGEIILADRGLMPNESSLFEIPFKNPPAEARVFKVEVTDFD